MFVFLMKRFIFEKCNSNGVMRINILIADYINHYLDLSCIKSIKTLFMKKRIYLLFFLLITSIGITLAQTQVVGNVADDTGEPVIGASILVKGTTLGTVTDIDGAFTISVPAGSNTLVVSYVGLNTQEVAVKPVLNIILSSDIELLDELVVVGYGTQKKANLTGAVTTVDVGKTLEARPYSDISKALQGAVPGLSIISSSGQVGKQPSLSIRGLGTLSNDATSKPLLIVDGVAMDDISLLNTQDIESISVLKDAASTSIYGTRAAFGVILINTKSASKTDRVSVNYTNNFSFDTPTILPDYPDVPSQIKALISANNRAGLANELFGMDLDQMLPYAEKWRD